MPISIPRAAIRAGLTRSLRLQLVSPCAAPPEGEGWLHEIKHDGHRLVATVVGRGSVKLLSRDGVGRTPLFRAPFRELAARGPALVLDGEIAVPDERGVTDLDALTDALAGDHIIQVALTAVRHRNPPQRVLNPASPRCRSGRRGQQGTGRCRLGEAKALAAQVAYLHRRSRALDLPVVLGAVGGATTCGAVLALFVGALREATIASVLFALFGLVCAFGAICAFTAEMLIASRGIRDEASASRPTGPG